MSYIEATSNIFIKYLFGKDEHKEVLLQFIKDVIGDGRNWGRSFIC